jgi:hypothetical protein
LVDVAVNNCMDNVKSWMNKHFLKLNHDKTQIIAFSTPTIYRNLTVDSINLSHCNLATTVIPLAEQVKYLGFIFDKHLSLSLLKLIIFAIIAIYTLIKY